MPQILRQIRRMLLRLQTAWSLMGITLVLLGLMEAGFRLAFAVTDHFRVPSQPDRRVLAEGYGGAAWPVRHYQEITSLRERWEPYVYFRPEAFHGATISIDADGLRSTWQPIAAGPPASHDRRPVEILMLGGSSLWGFGARDDQTIPSLVARRLFDKGQDVRIRNLAQIGYVSTQEVVALVRELQSGDHPDIVIFYDGVNDTTSALLEGEAGLTTNEINRRREFNILQSPLRLAAAFAARVVQDSGTYRFAKSVGRRLTGGEGQITRAAAGVDRARLAEDVVRRYEANVDLVERLGREYAFRPVFYWQPVVFGKRVLTAVEREEAARYAWAEPMVRDVLGRVRDSPKLSGDPGFHNLSGLFDDSVGLVFIDYCHTTESANERIAAAIADDVERRLGETAARTRSEAEQPGGRAKAGSVD